MLDRSIRNADRLRIGRRWLMWGLIGCGLLAGVADAADPTPQYPLAIAVDAQGTIYLADRNLPGIWRVKDGRRDLFFAGSKKFRTPLNAVRCLAIDTQGRLLAGDSATREVYRFGLDQQPPAAVPLPLTKGGIGLPMALAIDQSGNLFIADLETQRIFKQPAAGGDLIEFATVPAPRGMAFDQMGRLWVVSHGKDQILQLTADGKSEVVVSGRPFQFPHHITFDGQQNAYVADGYGKSIWKICAGQQPVKFAAGEPLSNPVGVAWLGEKLLVVDPRAKEFLYAIDTAGQMTAVPMPLVAP